ncbi:hypothetical protein BCV72DRAFT_220920 [Rhizopus microsporus var. microsporus]|uniref:Uncharacterized protein n=2 Tax=Rhizopus microsporus TaxID=58291 RepID=A0A2G4SK74_RHIZD|nr:uncharacterized protein RHIMIDRAFT_264263 [Rhizopus microsporus ATCC 52813]ORE10773.1 hypothetical protein BCV72DRAFT_220920 [Rhizopus microsporus var. microsporus]PHZ09179.1 hypothetical protein RHIMIDRAFT_264263 [Rhizopus microsporus ATCC 52813]
MGLDRHLLHLALALPKQYILINVVIFSCSVTKIQVNEGEIEQLINVILYIKKSALEMEAQINDARIKRHISKIDDFLGASPAV